MRLVLKYWFCLLGLYILTNAVTLWREDILGLKQRLYILTNAVTLWREDILGLKQRLYILTNAVTLWREDILGLKQRLYILTNAVTLWREDILGLKQRLSKALLREVMTIGSIDSKNKHHDILPIIYIITPTARRIEQLPDLTRMSHTLRLVPSVHWVVVEDKKSKSENVGKFLNGTGLNFTHLAVQKHTPNLHKGNPQRNLGLDWVTEHGKLPSVVYFADDDNTYDVRLFEEMRFTKRVSVWPVALAGGVKYETPILKNGKVVDFASGWDGERKFALDMAGFAVNSELIIRPNSPRFNEKVLHGYLETNFIEQLNVTLNTLEPRADNCTKILVWHTKTGKSVVSRTSMLERVLAKYKIKPIEI